MAKKGKLYFVNVNVIVFIEKPALFSVPLLSVLFRLSSALCFGFVPPLSALSRRASLELAQMLGNHIHSYEAVALGGVGDVANLRRYTLRDVVPRYRLGTGLYEQ